jgi:hypothetical protein
MCHGSRKWPRTAAGTRTRWFTARSGLTKQGPVFRRFRFKRQDFGVANTKVAAVTRKRGWALVEVGAVQQMG